MSDILSVFNTLEGIKRERLKEDSKGELFSAYRSVLNKLYLSEGNIYSLITDLLIVTMDSKELNKEDGDVVTIQGKEYTEVVSDIGRFYLELIGKRFGRNEVLELSNTVLLDKELQKEDLLRHYQEGMVPTVSYKFQYEDDEKSVNITEDLKVYLKQIVKGEEYLVCLVPQNGFEELDIAVLDTNKFSHISQDILDEALSMPERETSNKMLEEMSKMSADGSPLYKRIKHPRNAEEEAQYEESLVEFSRVEQEYMEGFEGVLDEWKDKNKADIYLYNVTIPLDK